MIIAITGGSGFIGNLLTEKHLQQGDQVHLLSRKISLKDNGVKYFIGDLADANVELFDFLDNVDILYHCAGEVNNESLMYELHVNGTQRLVDVAKGKVGRWVQLSSVGAYGVCRTDIVTEISIEQPSGVYEKTKTESDNIIKNSSIPYVILRPSNVFGLTMPNQSLFQLISMINKGLFFYLGKKGALVNYVHVDDVVEALFVCGRSDDALENVYNLSQTIEIESMVSAFACGLGIRDWFLRFPELPILFLINIFGKLPKFPLTESRVKALTNRCRYNSDKITQALGFEFKSTLEEHFQLMASDKWHL